MRGDAGTRRWAPWIGAAIGLVAAGCGRLGYDASAGASPPDDAAPAPDAARVGLWGQRKTIVVDGARVTGEVEEFPVLVRIAADPDLATIAADDGSDLRFALASSDGILAHELERWDPVTGELTAWVRVPALAAGVDTAIQLYFGEPVAGPATAASVWPERFVSCLHFGAPAVGLLGDSAVPARTAESMGVEAAPAVVGDGLTFTTSMSYVEFAGTQGFVDGAESFALSFWLYPDYASDAAWPEVTLIDQQGTLTGGRTFRGSSGAPDGHAKFQLDVTFEGAGATFRGPYVQRQVWQQVTVAYDGEVLRYYVDGVEADADPVPGDRLATAIRNFRLGSSGSTMLGSLDEVRVMVPSPGEAWLATAYASQADPVGFAAVGPLEVP